MADSGPLTVNNTPKPRKKTRARNSASSPPRVRIADVAQEAGLSTATVSRALNMPETVSDQNRQRVSVAIARLGYVRDGVARALAMQSTRTIGAIVPTIENSIFANAIMTFQKQLSLHGYILLLATTEYHPDLEMDKVLAFIERGVEGILLVGEQRDQGVYDLLQARNIPFINTWLYREEAPFPCVGFDHDRSTSQIVDHLVDLGHRKMGIITGFVDKNDRAAARLRVALDAARRHGVPIPFSRVVETSYSVKAARKVAHTLMKANGDITALICGNDILALGAIYACGRLGLKVPDDVSIFGHGDFDFASEMRPALTTLQLPEQAIGAKAADFLLARLQGKTPEDHIELPTKLCIRDTTGPVPTKKPTRRARKKESVV